MKTETIVCFIVALLLGMLLANMLKNVCGCKIVEGQRIGNASDYDAGATAVDIIPVTQTTNNQTGILDLMTSQGN
tara:strand:- start:131 stop:355 length:225 start_codon:yes stop_codon:yes gene_type:complete